MDVVYTEHISRAFQEKEVLRDVTLRIEEKEIFGLLGPSGAGKTTLIKILTGQLKASRGTARVFGADCNSMRQEDYDRIGMVLDNSGLYNRLSCYDNMKVFTGIYGVKDTYIMELLERVGLKSAAKLAAGKLSKGMRQRLVLARALLHKPELLFLDEPTSGLDPVTTKSIHELLFELQKEGASIFLTTHNMEEASKLCNHVALLNEGKIVEYGEPGELCRKHNELNIVTILCVDGSKVVLQNEKESAGKISACFASGTVEAIHSSEPNLETVFMKLTGRGLA